MPVTTYPLYLIAAYGIFWLLTFALVFSIWARQRALEARLRDLEAAWSDTLQRGGDGVQDGAKAPDYEQRGNL